MSRTVITAPNIASGLVPDALCPCGYHGKCEEMRNLSGESA